MTRLHATSQSFYREEVLRSDLSEILRLEELLSELAYKAGFSEERAPLFVVAVTEALSNAILHGNREQPEKSVFLRVRWEPEHKLLSVEVQDEGEGFDYTNLPDPTQEDNLLRESGRGIFLMKSLANEVLFREGGRCVELRFFLP
ncbi:MAG: ATP-binding protein [Bacteroidia bacterium]|nr:ATP-binding protein [Bacteroidia bacterium]MCX7764000.1 ATP-binding protein [Bacteroidia bacterium]MDW8056868.1 ATP-binding protein [Bacteroidia bacterium]